MTRWKFWIDVGGTFTDCVACPPAGFRSAQSMHSGHLEHYKMLSSGVVKGCALGGSTKNHIMDPLRSLDPDGVWIGYQIRLEDGSVGVVEDFRNGLLTVSGITVQVGDRYEVSSHEPAPLVVVRYLLAKGLRDDLPAVDIRLGTTRGTNALITRSGSRVGLVTTRGFRDVLRIGYQARPELFALNIRKPDELYEAVVEIDERVTAEGEVLGELNLDVARLQLEQLRTDGLESLAIVLLHASANPSHEQQLGELARKVGFREISLSHEISSLRKIVPRGDTTVMDAYLNPILRSYVESIRSVLDPQSSLLLMTSSGGLVEDAHFRGKDSILSGPAGGVVAVAHVAQTLGRSSAIGFDMGGTSTDVSRWSGAFDLEFENEKAGQRIASPMMRIETVAAGGGSICHFDGVKLTVGPESAGAEPGPACYGRGGPLAVTDINLYLGRILASAFPFSLDIEAVEHRLDAHRQKISEATGKSMSRVELANGYLRVANANMAEAIRCVSFEQGIDARDDLLVGFGGAAAQHACAIADELGIREVALHPFAGIMSAFGIGLAQQMAHAEQGVYQPIDDVSNRELEAVFTELEKQCCEELGESAEGLELRRSLDLRFVGLSEALPIAQPSDGDFGNAYVEEFRSRNGYLPEDRRTELVTARVSAAFSHVVSTEVVSTEVVANVGSDSGSDSGSDPSTPVSSTGITFGDEKRVVDVYKRRSLTEGQNIMGPAMISESISTIVVDPGWQAVCLAGGEIVLTRQHSEKKPELPLSADAPAQADPVLLEVFNQRFAAIATQMGTTLRKISRSVNVKERLDYSCAIFTADGELVVNAPHIPVHLGAMGATVRHVLHSIELSPGDVVVTNDPYHGGSHLPDVTVITPVHDEGGTLLFFTASRAHHAEIGGVTPGSMPAFSKNLAEEGILIRATKIVVQGEPQFESIAALLTSTPYPSRDPEMNLADMRAQIAANRRGADALLKFVEHYTWDIVSAYMQFIQTAAEMKTRQALRRLSDGTRKFTDYLDDGTPIRLSLTVSDDEATLDFGGTGDVLSGNLNANPAIVTAATLYCLRLLIDEEIPLNEGVLRPVKIVIPTGLLNPISHESAELCPAIVGGNVETSQRVVDVILGAFGIAAASQGTMNNFLFGNDSFGYYETICGGAGATGQGDGADAVHTHMTNTRLTDPETLEQRFPVRLNRFEIRRGSGGAGQYRGGDGVAREVEFLTSLEVSLLTQRRGDYSPYSIGDGQPGQTGANHLLRSDGEVEVLGGTASCQVKQGDRIVIQTPGGGGWSSDITAKQ